LKYCEAKGYGVGYQLAETWSGLSIDRPKLTELRELVRSGKVDAVVVYSLDRFSRDPVHGVILMQELEKHGVSLEATSEVVDNSEVGKLVFYIKGYAAKLDAERRRDATGRGKKALLKSGKLPQGTGIGIYGYQWIREYKKRTPIESEANVVRRVFETVSNGKSCFSVARLLNEASVPSKSGKKWEARTISRMVRNRAYCGETYFGQTVGDGKERKNVPRASWTLLPDTTSAIVTKELFERIQTALARSKELHPGKATHEYPLTGFAVCGYCGSPLVGSCLRGGYRYYHCRGTYPTSSRNRICNARYIPAAWLEDAVWQKVKGVLSQPEVLVSEIIRKQNDSEFAQAEAGTLEQEIKGLSRKLKQYAGQERRLMDVLRMEVATPDFVLDTLNQMKREREADQSRLASLVKTRESIAGRADFEGQLRDLCARIAPDLDNCTCQDKKDAYTYLGLNIVATPEGIDIKGYLDPNVLSPSVLTTEQTSALPRERSCPSRRV
jgi:site-specific DNA recombinase